MGMDMAMPNVLGGCPGTGECRSRGLFLRRRAGIPYLLSTLSTGNSTNVTQKFLIKIGIFRKYPF
jgi:hypothetical protein